LIWLFEKAESRRQKAEGRRCLILNTVDTKFRIKYVRRGKKKQEKQTENVLSLQ
jgi:hypothetical protein